jgi:hypothetical protein
MKKLMLALALAVAGTGCTTLDTRVKGVSALAYDKELDQLYVVESGSLAVCSKANGGRKLSCKAVTVETQ